MEKRGIMAIVLIIIVSGGIIGVFILQQGGIIPGGGRIQLAGLSLSTYVEEREMQISLIRIGGNSTDIVYPELMESEFVPLSSGEWQVSASFVDDSSGYDALEIYERTFTANLSEVMSINTALYDGLTLTFASIDTHDDIMYVGMGFSLDIEYNDGSWISLLTLQDTKGHLILMSGTGTPNLNLLDGYILEPGTALDGLADAINAVFTYHLG